MTIPEIQDISKQLGERDIMWNKKTKNNPLKPLNSEEYTQTRQKLSHEILGLSAISMAIALFSFVFLNATANSIVRNYCEIKDIIFTETVE